MYRSLIYWWLWSFFSLKKTEVLCHSGKAPKLLGIGRRRRAVRKDFVSLVIDGLTLHSSEPYEYKRDAVVISLSPSSTIHNGGTRVTVTGTYLDTVQKPQIGVKLSNGDETTGVSYIHFINNSHRNHVDTVGIALMRTPFLGVEKQCFNLVI